MQRLLSGKTVIDISGHTTAPLHNASVAYTLLDELGDYRRLVLTRSRCSNDNDNIWLKLQID